MITVENLSFTYLKAAEPALRGLSFGIARGEIFGFLGPSGAGKSTVAALLLGMLEPAGGRISVAGVDLRSCRIDAWRRQIAWVPQHPTLFRATVADNIRLGDPGASERSVHDAAVRAGADAFIAAWDAKNTPKE